MSTERAKETTTAAWLLDRVDVLGVGITAVNLGAAVAIGAQWIDEHEQRRIHFCNVHSVMEARRNPVLLSALNTADMAAPDGMPLVWLAHQAGHPSAGRVYGPDFMLAMCEFGLSRGWRHYFYGGADGVAARLAERLRFRMRGLQVAGVYGPPFRAAGAQESSEILDGINATHPDILWVGLGTPKQDIWLAQHQHLLRVPLVTAVGAAFDFHAGLVPQAPRWMQSRGLEWLFRLAHEPSRLWYRYLVYNPQFVARVALQKIAATRNRSA